MKNTLGAIFFSLFFLVACDSADVPVKKSKTNICHQKGSKYYDQTKHFRAYNTVKDCIDSGGRLPKKR